MLRHAMDPSAIRLLSYAPISITYAALCPQRIDVSVFRFIRAFSQKPCRNAKSNTLISQSRQTTVLLFRKQLILDMPVSTAWWEDYVRSANSGAQLTMVWYSPFSPQRSIPAFMERCLRSVKHSMSMTRPFHDSGILG